MKRTDKIRSICDELEGADPATTARHVPALLRDVADELDELRAGAGDASSSTSSKKRTRKKAAKKKAATG